MHLSRNLRNRCRCSIEKSQSVLRETWIFLCNGHGYPRGQLAKDSIYPKSYDFFHLLDDLIWSEVSKCAAISCMRSSPNRASHSFGPKNSSDKVHYCCVTLFKKNNEVGAIVWIVDV